MYSKLFLLLICFSVVLATNANTQKENEKKTTEDKVRDAVKLWEQSFSGFPINCRRVVDLFADDGVAEIPVGQAAIPAGRKMFGHCEQNLLPHFTHIETFVSGPLYITGTQVSFERSVMLVTKTSCRLVSHGITSLSYDKDFKIKVMKDFVNINEFTTSFESCQFPTLPAEEEKQKARDDAKEL